MFCKQTRVKRVKMKAFLLIVIIVLSAVTCYGNSPPYPINCDAEEGERWCFYDAFPWCIVGKPEPVYGHCGLQDAVCSGGEIDYTNSCYENMDSST